MNWLPENRAEGKRQKAKGFSFRSDRGFGFRLCLLNNQSKLEWRGWVSLIGVAIAVSGCQDPVSITPPPQALGNSLNSLHAEQFPRFNYDGRYLVFASDRRGQREIYLYDRIRGQLQPLPGLNRPSTWQDQPDISADGRYIVYLSEQTGKPDIWLYDRQTFTPKNLTENWLGEARHPSISGNGRFITFESNRNGQWDVVLLDRGTGIDLSLPAPSP
jgi:Tol biopolymer transport system component